ncbi:MAG: O-antigen ligase family protein [Opitutales bacterium]
MESTNRQHDPARLREWLLAGVVALTIVLPAWDLGGARWKFAQLMLLCGASLALVLALLPLPGPRSIRRPQGSWRRVLTFAPLIPASLLLAQLITQNLNPAFDQVFTPRALWPYEMVPRDDSEYLTWLPSGYTGIFSWYDGWRQVAILGSAFMLSLAIWTGLPRRRHLWFLLGVIALNAGALGVLSLLQTLTEAEKILWLVPSPNPNFAATFAYRGHGAVYLCLGAAAAVAVGLHSARHARRRGLKSSPAPLWWLLAALALVATFASGSRLGALFAALMSIASVGLISLEIVRSGGFAIGLTLTLALLVLGASWWQRERIAALFSETTERFESALEAHETGGIDGSLQNRLLTATVTLRMGEDRPWFGWGPGSFRYFFPRYQSQEPGLRGFASVRSEYKSRMMPERLRLQFSQFYYAHSDPAQYLAEWGRVGFSLALAALLVPCAVMLLHAGGWSLEATSLALGLHGVLAVSVLDLPLSNAAIFTLFTVVVTLLTRMVLLRHANRRTDSTTA